MPGIHSVGDSVNPFLQRRNHYLVLDYISSLDKLLVIMHRIIGIKHNFGLFLTPK